MPRELRLWGGRRRCAERWLGELQDNLVLSIAHNNTVVTHGFKDKPVDGLADAGGDAAAGPGDDGNTAGRAAAHDGGQLVRRLEDHGPVPFGRRSGGLRGRRSDLRL